MSPSPLRYLLTASPAKLAQAVADHEHALFVEGTDLSLPEISLMTIDVDRPGAVFIPIVLPYTVADLRQLGGTRRRGQFGRFVASLACTFRRMPPQVLRLSLPEWGRGQRLLYTAFAARTVQVGEVPDHASDLELDVPAARQNHQRCLYACDGRGSLYQISRPDGPPGPPGLSIVACRADPDRPGRYTHHNGPGAQRLGSTSLLPWALDMLAQTCRTVFEEEATCGSGGGSGGGSGEAKPPPGRIARRSRRR